jgi:hypothetical protein
MDPAIKEKATHLAHQLYEAIDTGNREQILAAQAELSAFTDAIWQRIDHADISPKEKAIARLLAEMAIKELPEKIQDPANYHEIQHQLRLLKNSLVLLD